MNRFRHEQTDDEHTRQGVRGFTLIELLVVLTVIAILSSLLLPVLSRSKGQAQGLVSLNNTRQLALAWQMYADDNSGRLAYNLGGPNRGAIAAKSRANWVNNNLTWELDSDNTNTATLVEAGLGSYVAMGAKVYRCPQDTALSSVQRKAGWSSRVRSYSMNAMVGDAGELTTGGFNLNNPSYRQFFKMTSIPAPTEIFVFVEEHADSINDGYFLNKVYSREWIDLPTSHHNGAGVFSFADGHCEVHRWRSPTTIVRDRPDAAQLPRAFSNNDSADFLWVISHMTVAQ
ncbi:MAG: prepilin-type N-terminal cleavage/methylation domain-containing protein [Opitutaceae bacterium]|nr:prepilin-type N-terminal cleavage/methylation domain-containing protein [Verrucomicrobiales bacterium]